MSGIFHFLGVIGPDAAVMTGTFHIQVRHGGSNCVLKVGIGNITDKGEEDFLGQYVILRTAGILAQQGLAVSRNLNADHLPDDLGRAAHHIPVDVLAIREYHLAQCLNQLSTLDKICAIFLHRFQEFLLHGSGDMHGLLAGAGHAVVIGTVIDSQHGQTIQILIVVADNLLAVALSHTEAGTAAGINSLDHTRATGGDIHIALSQQFIRGLNAAVLRLNDLNQISRSPQCLNLFANQIHRLQ